MTNKVNLTPELTQEEIVNYEEKSKEIANKRGFSKVHPVVQIDPETLERKVCYLSEPNYFTKLALMDKAVQLGPYIAGEEMRNVCIIKEESDLITYGDAPECDSYKMGVVDYCLTMVSRIQNQFKKK